MVSRKQALSPSETRVLFFCNFKSTLRKPSFMAIIAQLITLWRLQTCVIYIFPSSHLARRLENASMRGVNLAITQPSPFSPTTPSPNPSRPGPERAVPASQVMLSCLGHSDAFPSPPAAPRLAGSLGSGDFLLCCTCSGAAEFGQDGRARLGGCCCYPCKCSPKEARDSLMTGRDQEELFCHLKQSTKYEEVVL